MGNHDTDFSWGALAVAILFECPVSPEEAMELYESGSIVLGGKKHRAGTIIKSCRLARLRARGCAWWAISEMTGISSPESYIAQRRGLVAEVEERKRTFSPAKRNEVIAI